MLTGIISFLTALLKAVPILASLFEKFSKKQTEVNAAQRLESKNDAVDAGIDAALQWVPASDAEQLHQADEKKRLSAGGEGGPGVGEGRPENN